MVAITLPTWEVDGWTANAIDDTGVIWFTGSPDGTEVDSGWFEPPGVRLAHTDRSQGNGVYRGRNYRTPRVITLHGYGRAPTNATASQALDQFSALLSDGGLSVLTVTEPTDTRIAYVELGGQPRISRTSPREWDWQLVLIAADPNKYSSVVKTNNTGLAVAAPGGVLWGGPAGVTGVPWGGPAGTTGVVWQSGVSSTGTMTLANAGNESAPIEFVITDPAEAVVNPTITEFGTGNVLSYGATVPQGSSLVINTATGSVLLDGANRAPLMTRVEWMTIPAWGSTQVVFSATGSAPSANLLARWSDTYI